MKSKKYFYIFYNIPNKYSYNLLKKKYYKILLSLCSNKKINFEEIDFYINKGTCLLTISNKSSLDDLTYPIEIASETGHLDLVKYLLSKNKETDILFCLNWALVFACENNHIDIVKYLISIGANSFKLSIKFAKYNNNKEIIKYLKSIQKK